MADLNNSRLNNDTAGPLTPHIQDDDNDKSDFRLLNDNTLMEIYETEEHKEGKFEK